MKDEDKSKAQLIHQELANLRQQIVELKAKCIRGEQALQASEIKFQALLKAAPDAVVIANNQGRITLINDQAQEMFGYDRSELLGEPIEILLPERLQLLHIQQRTDYLASPHSRPMGLGLNIVGCHQDGREFPLDVKLTPVETPEGLLIVSIIRDITEHKQVREREKLAYKLGRQLTALLDPDTLLLETAIRLRETFGYYHAHVFLYVEVPGPSGEKEGLLVVREGVGKAGTEMNRRHTIPLNARQSLAARAGRLLEPVVVNDVTREPTHLFNPLLPDTRAEAAIPIYLGQRLIGVLDVQHTLVDHFDAHEVRTLQIVASQLSVALSNAQLFAENARRLAIIENSSDLIALADLKDGLINYMNPAGVRLVGCETMEEVIGQPLANFHTIEAFKRLETEGLAIAFEQGWWRGENVLRRTNGAVVPIDQMIFVIHDERDQTHTLATIVTDITERKRAEESLRRYAERLKILHNIDRSILAARSLEAIAQAVLGHLRQLIPCQRASVAEFDFKSGEAHVLATQVKGETQVKTGARLPLEIFGITEEFKQDRVQVVQDVLSFPQSSVAAQTFQAEGVRSYINVPLIAQGELIGLINLGANQPAAFAPEHIDITREAADQLAVAIQQARLHEQVKHYAAELEQRVLERTAALQEINAELESFSYSVSHDLRAPLRAVQGFADALLEDYTDKLDETGREYTRRITAAAERMDILIQDLLAYSRLSRADLRIQSISLATVMSEVLTQLETEFQARQVQITVIEPLPSVMGHHATLVQVITNLLTNAIKFTPTGMHPIVKIWTEVNEDWVRLWIADNGIGMAPEHHERIFHVFERLHGIETYPGTGIGLAIVRKGVERLGGRVGVVSALNQGSKFWIKLPGVTLVDA